MSNNKDQMQLGAHITWEFRELQTEQLKPCRLQPDVRTDTARLSSLNSQIRNQILHPIAVVPSKNGLYTIADGHRRREIASRRGWATVPCQIYYGISAEDLWVVLNAGTARLSGKHWFTGWAKCAQKERKHFLGLANKTIRGSIERMVHVFGEKRAEEIALFEWVPPHAAHHIGVIYQLLLKYCKDKAPTERQVGEWLLAKRTRFSDMFSFPRLANARNVRKLCTAMHSGKDFLRGQWG